MSYVSTTGLGAGEVIRPQMRKVAPLVSQKSINTAASMALDLPTAGQDIAQAGAAVEEDKTTKYLMIGGAVLGLGVVGYLLLKK